MLTLTDVEFVNSRVKPNTRVGLLCQIAKVMESGLGRLFEKAL